MDVSEVDFSGVLFVEQGSFDNTKKSEVDEAIQQIFAKHKANNVEWEVYGKINTNGEGEIGFSINGGFE